MHLNMSDAMSDSIINLSFYSHKKLIYRTNGVMPLNFCTPEVEEQRNSSGVGEKNVGIL